MFELRELRYFVALAEERHFGRAADRVYLTQSALSHAMQKLERKLGLMLFDRSGGTVRLTEAGAELLLEARDVVASAGRLSQRVEQLRSGATGRISIAYVPSVQDTIAAPVRAFTAGGGVTVEHRRQYHDVVLAAVEQGIVDVGIIHSAPVPEMVNAVPFRFMPLIAVVAPRHALVPAQTVTLADVARFRIPYVHAAGAEIWRALFSHHGLAPDVVAIDDPVTGAPLSLLAENDQLVWLQTREWGSTGDLPVLAIEPPVNVAFDIIFRADSENLLVAPFVEHLRYRAR